MKKRKKNEGSGSEKKLANRLNERIEKQTKSETEASRLGDRLSRRIEEYAKKREESGTSGDTLEATDFFEEITRLAEKHPELENVKVSELKKAISQTGMSHPEEVVNKLRKEEYQTRLRELEDEWVTY
ncbi:hypothetical protein AKJ56_00580 [candidate division MSBL1 archaeon SCGC-AAA382N08]|uniref:Uncharacterized protein n=1 Tax=candidate division MSBL1 archaeon SCGC-AAA382N08 TaxID=1698285 RepID=A0A133VQJ5_9EURY|nr:hypothetical protein AKJ56_00580 [candidate division MSBL1 archaeon SCGC-AAA382N08]